MKLKPNQCHFITRGFLEYPIGSDEELEDWKTSSVDPLTEFGMGFLVNFLYLKFMCVLTKGTYRNKYNQNQTQPDNFKAKLP